MAMDKEELLELRKKNLEHRRVITPEIAREMQLKGAATKKKNAQIKAWAKEILGRSTELIDENGEKEQATRAARVAMALIRKAEDGDVKAAELVLKMGGELEDKVHVETDNPGLIISFKKPENAGD